eukprot:14678302-Ditylum_brightwellii.AAC.1
MENPSDQESIPDLEYWRLNQANNSKTTSKDDDVSTALASSDEGNKSEINIGLGMALHPIKSVRRAPSGSSNLEKFLHRLESDLLELDNNYKQVPLRWKDKEFGTLFRRLRDEEVVVIPTDKTNNYVT